MASFMLVLLVTILLADNPGGKFVIKDLAAVVDKSKDDVAEPQAAAAAKTTPTTL